MFGMSRAGAAGKKAAPKAASKKPVLVSVTVKLEASQRDKFKALGGDAWLQERIDAAEAPEAGKAGKLGKAGKSAQSPFALEEEDS